MVIDASSVDDAVVDRNGSNKVRSQLLQFTTFATQGLRRRTRRRRLRKSNPQNRLLKNALLKVRTAALPW